MNQDKTRTYIFSTGFSLLAVFCIFFFADFLKKPLPYNLKTADSKSLFEAKKTKRKNDYVEKHLRFKDSTLFIDTAKVVFKAPVCAKDTNIKSILLIGDSQVEFLKTSVYNFCIDNNYKLVAAVAWYGSTTAAFAPNDTMNYFIEKYKPDFVLIAIGLNEVLTTNVEPRRKYIDEITQNLVDKKIPYFWIGPPAWTKDGGIINVMKEEMDTLFYDSKDLVLERWTDGRHPSMEASKIWFDSAAVAIERYTPLTFPVKVKEYKKVENSAFIALGKTKKDTTR